MTAERNEQFRGHLLMAAFICPMVAGGAILAGSKTGLTIVLVGGTLSAFVAAGSFGPTEFDGWPGVRVIQAERPPVEALRELLFYVIWLVLGFAGGALITSLFV